MSARTSRLTAWLRENWMALVVTVIVEGCLVAIIVNAVTR